MVETGAIEVALPAHHLMGGQGDAASRITADALRAIGASLGPRRRSVTAPNREARRAASAGESSANGLPPLDHDTAMLKKSLLSAGIR